MSLPLLILSTLAFPGTAADIPASDGRTANRRDVASAELCNCNSGSLERCGPLALQVAAATAGRPTKLSEIDGVLGSDDVVTSLAQLQSAAQRLGLATAAMRWSADLPVSTDAPAVIPIVKRNGAGHFITAVARREDQVLVVDVPFPPLWMELSKLRTTYRWSGAALHVSRAADALPRYPAPSHVALRAITGIAAAASSYVVISLLFRRRFSSRKPMFTRSAALSPPRC
jgi:ABC-type bacteriocin/lantibiotic exporter with double-glycine peptidase domain